jgi:hypothetical protein
MKGLVRTAFRVARSLGGVLEENVKEAKKRAKSSKLRRKVRSKWGHNIRNCRIHAAMWKKFGKV